MKNKIISKLRERFIKSGLDADSFDYEAYWDSNLNPEENKRILKEKIDESIGKQLNELYNEANSPKYQEQQKDEFTDWLNKNKMEVNKIRELFSEPKIIGLSADVHSGKSNALYYFIKILKEKYDFNLYSYGLRYNLNEIKIYSLEELEKIKDSVVIIDEFYSLFDLEDRRKRKLIEKSLRLINHNNNILVLAGVCQNFKKFISAKLDIILFGKCSLEDFINGSKIKQVCLSYRGIELGSSVLDIPINQLLIYDGKHYQKFNIPYLPQFDRKINNVPILVEK